MKQRTLKQLTATAYHEAGHAVAAVWHEFGVAHITIEASEDCLGHCAHAPADPEMYERLEYDNGPDVRIYFENRILGLLAGPQAERLFTGRNNHHGAGSDWQQALDFAIALCGSLASTTAYLKWMRLRAHEFVNNPYQRSKVDAVAHALLERQTLSGEDVRQIIMDATAPANI